MKRFDTRSIITIILTLVYVSLLFNVVHLPSPLDLSLLRGPNDSTKEALGKHSPRIADDSLGSQDSSPYPPWFQLPQHLARLGSRLLPDFDTKAASTGSEPTPQKLPIGGSWRNSLIHLGATDLDLPSTAVFTRTSPTAMDEILPSSANGYLNSRIDLRRRKRAFEIASNTEPPSIVLQLRKDAALLPRNMDPLMLREEFEGAVVRNRRLKEAITSRKLRKGQRRKKDIKVNPAG